MFKKTGKKILHLVYIVLFLMLCNGVMVDTVLLLANFSVLQLAE
jgi:hypothetical protein